MSYRAERLRALDGRLNDLDQQIRSERNPFDFLHRSELRQYHDRLTVENIDPTAKALILIEARALPESRIAAGRHVSEFDYKCPDTVAPLVDSLNPAELAEIRDRLSLAADPVSLLREIRAWIRDRENSD